MRQAISGYSKNESVWSNKNFVYLLIASLFSSLGASMFLFTQAWYIITVLDMEAAVGIVMIGATLPQIILLFIGGVIADRKNKARLMFLSDLTRFILVLSLVLCLSFFSIVPIEVFIAYAVIFGILGAFFYPARDSIVPILVSRDHLIKANSMIQGTNQLSMIVGPLLCGVLILNFDFQLTFLMVSCALAIGTLAIYFIKVKITAKTSLAPNENVKNELIEGINYVKKSKILKGLLFISILINLIIMGPMVMGLPIFVNTILNGTAFDFSLMEGALSVGLLLGSIIMFLTNTTKNRGLITLSSLLLLSISYFFFSLTETLYMSLIMVFIVGSFIQITVLPVISIIQNQVSEEYLGRVMSLLTISAMGLTPISYGMTSIFLNMNLTIDEIMSFSSILLVIVSCLIFWKAKAIRSIQ